MAFDLDSLLDALPETTPPETPSRTPQDTPDSPEVFTPEILEVLVERVRAEGRAWEVGLEGGKTVRIYPTREDWERGDRTGLEFYADELLPLLPALSKILLLKEVFSAELVDWKPPT